MGGMEDRLPRPGYAPPMSPIILYGTLVMVPLVLAVWLRYVIVVPRRDCIQCGRSVAVTAARCRHCGYRYAAEDRAYMATLVADRKARFFRSRR
jgi:tRNA(Ile2) C34 agmatinyltransferase TiaS